MSTKITDNRAGRSRFWGLFDNFRLKGPSLRVLVIFVRHGNTKYSDALEWLIHYYAQCHSNVDRSIIIVDNAMEPGTEVFHSDYVLIGGRNTEWEFSAIDDAISYAGTSILHYDFIHIVTSAFRRYGTDFIDLVTTTMLQRIIGRNVCLGHIDSYDDEVFLLGKPADYWIRTSFFFLPPTTVLRLGSFVSIPQTFTPVLFSGDPDQPFRSKAPLSDRLKQYVTDWLTGEGTGQAVVWHSRFDLNAKSLRFFEHKALAIINENLLTRRLVGIGSAPLDASYFHSIGTPNRLITCAGIENDVPTQLKTRGVFLRANN